MNYSAFNWALDMLYNAIKKINKAATVSIVFLPALQAPMRGFWSNVPEEYHLYALLVLALLSMLLLVGARYISRPRSTMTRRRKRTLLEKQEFVRTVVKAKKVGDGLVKL